jgi:hypothetical protein
MKIIYLILCLSFFTACATTNNKYQSNGERNIAEATSSPDESLESNAALSCTVSSATNGIVCNDPKLKCLTLNFDNGVICNDLSVACTVNTDNKMLCNKDSNNINRNYNRVLKMNTLIINNCKKK